MRYFPVLPIVKVVPPLEGAVMPELGSMLLNATAAPEETVSPPS